MSNINTGVASTLSDHPAGDFLLVANSLSELTPATVRTNIGLAPAGSNPTPGSTVAITINANPIQVFKWTAGENETVNITGTPALGQQLILIIVNDGVLARTITLGTGLLGTAATILGIASKRSVIKFVGDGTQFIEISRAVAF